MLNFTNNLEAYTTTHRSAKAKQFMEFTSKKQLRDAQILTAEEIDFIDAIKGTFSFAVHVDMRYVAVTLYRANAEKKYDFLVLDLQEKKGAPADSIKTAKAGILELAEAEKAEDEAHNEDSEEHTEEAVQA